MGQAIANSLKNLNDFTIYIVDPTITPKQEGNVNYLTSPNGINETLFTFVFLATKPQILPEIAPTYQKFLSKETILISIMAGKSLEILEEFFGKETKIIRLMPNLAASFGQSTTTACKNKNINEADYQKTNQACQSFGNLTWLADEELMHISTAINGSGPAMFALIVKTIEEEAERHLLPKEKARSLALSTMSNTITLLEKGTSADELMQQVASKGGTTEAMLNSLKQNKLSDVLEKALNAAASKSKNF